MDCPSVMFHDSEAVLPVNVIDLRPYLEGQKLGHSVDDIHAALHSERVLQIARQSMVEDHMQAIKRNEVFMNLIK